MPKKKKEKKTKKLVKETRRSKAKFPGLLHRFNSKLRWEMIDFDYLDKLSDEEKQWLSNFNEEYLSGNFNHPGKIFHKKKKEKRECYTRNNARNRDIYALYRTRGWVPVIEGDPKVESKNPNPSSQEDAIIEMIDLSREDT